MTINYYIKTLHHREVHYRDSTWTLSLYHAGLGYFVTETRFRPEKKEIDLMLSVKSNALTVNQLLAITNPPPLGRSTVLQLTRVARTAGFKEHQLLIYSP